MGEVLLTVDTSSSAGSIALSRGESLLGEILLNVAGTHSDRLLGAIQFLLGHAGMQISQVDAYGVVLGPGAFTGLRVGVATVKGLALAGDRPVVGVSSLRAVAMQVPFAEFPVCPLLDARKGEVYAGLFRWEGGGPRPLMKEQVISPDRLLEGFTESVLFLGPGSEAYRTLIVRRLGSRAHFAPWPNHPPRASSAAVIALEELRQGRTVPPALLNPVYIRPSEAEILWASRQRESFIEG